ncbi:MAG: multicopper oxidase domain-containing protein [Longimicrobiales bacterium]
MLVISMVRSLALASTVVLNTTPPDCRSLPDPKAIAAIPNDNRQSAGIMKDGVLTVRLVARPAAWQPEGKNGCGIRVHAFAEEGKPAQIPGPLIRVPVGTQVRVILRNELAQPLKIRGLFERQAQRLGPGLGREVIDASAVEIPAGASRELSFRVTLPGNFFYWGITPIDTLDAYPFRPPGVPMPLFSPFEDSQLVGALIVDPEGGSPPDRIFVMTHWRLPGSDPDEAGIRQINGINGLSWPHTERLSATVGDTLRWRVLNGSNAPHTMHLHGFYYRVLSQGSFSTFDSILPPPQQRAVVSEFLFGNRTMTLEWVPERAGNWLFHCHFIAHMRPDQRIARVFGSTPETAAAHSNHAGHDMAGLVVGISVASRGTAVRATPAPPKRHLRLFASERPRVFGEDPGYGFVLQEGTNAPARDPIRIPGTPLALTKGEPTQITVFNRLQFPLAVHWHGIELESYYDGVPDFSGAPNRIAPAIAPGDSFVVQMTPPRAGTFFYHIHSEQANELLSGLYGALVVLDPAKRHDPSADRTFVISGGGRGRTANQTILVNGTTKPEAIEMAVGVPQRLRFISIPANGSFDVRVTGASTPPVWRQIARDGADLPAQQVSEGAAQIRIAVGVAMDFEFTPTAPGELVLQVDLPRGVNAVAGFATRVPIRVRAAGESRSGQDPMERRRNLERALALLEDESKWQSNDGKATLSDLLWSVFCAVETTAVAAAPAPAARRNGPCTALEGFQPPNADANTIAQARAMIRRALERTRSN